MTENPGGFLLLGLFLALVFWSSWYSEFLFTTSLASRPRDRLLLYLGLPICLLLLALSMGTWHLRSVACWIMGAAWLGLASRGLRWLGLAIEDVSERRNHFAGWAIAAAQAGLAFAFGCAASNTNFALTGIVLGIAANLAFFAVWGILELASHPSEAISVNRDGGAALRLAGFLGALGLLLCPVIAVLLTIGQAGRPWRLAAPFLLLLAALPLERWSQRTFDPLNGLPKPRDVVVTLAYLAAAGIILVWGTI